MKCKCDEEHCLLVYVYKTPKARTSCLEKCYFEGDGEKHLYHYESMYPEAFEKFNNYLTNKNNEPRN